MFGIQFRICLKWSKKTSNYWRFFWDEIRLIRSTIEIIDPNFRHPWVKHRCCCCWWTFWGVTQDTHLEPCKWATTKKIALRILFLHEFQAFKKQLVSTIHETTWGFVHKMLELPVVGVFFNQYESLSWRIPRDWLQADFFLTSMFRKHQDFSRFFLKRSSCCFFPVVAWFYPASTETKRDSCSFERADPILVIKNLSEEEKLRQKGWFLTLRFGLDSCFPALFCC